MSRQAVRSWVSAGLGVTAALLIAPRVALPGIAVAQASPEASVEQLARDVQAHYDTVRDFTADFEQAYEGGLLRQRTVERGSVAIKKPGRMHWEYTDPEPKLFVSDGSQLYSYVPADTQVIVQALPDEGRASTPVLFLSGRGDLLRDFTVELADAGLTGGGSWPPETHALKLVPKQREPEYDWLVLVVDAESLTIRQLVTRDGQGGMSTFTFTNLRENVGLPDERFHFQIPRDADVIRQG